MTVNRDEWTDAIEDAEQVMLRWGHGQVRRVPDELVTEIVAALRSVGSERRQNEIIVPKPTGIGKVGVSSVQLIYETPALVELTIESIKRQCERKGDAS